MARRPQIAGEAHISFTGPDLPPFAKGVWRDLETVIGLELKPSVRKAIRQATTYYVLDVRLQRNATEMAGLLGRRGKGGKQHKASPLTRLAGAINDVVARWREADQDDVASRALIGLAAAVEVRTQGEIRADEIREKLELYGFELRSYLSDLASGIDHADVAGPFRRLVTRLADIITKAGGSVSGRDTYAGPLSRRARERGQTTAKRRPSRFQAFMRRLNQCIPGDVQQRAASDEAFDALVRKALTSNKRAAARL